MTSETLAVGGSARMSALATVSIWSPLRSRLPAAWNRPAGARTWAPAQGSALEMAACARAAAMGHRRRGPGPALACTMRSRRNCLTTGSVQM